MSTEIEARLSLLKLRKMGPNRVRWLLHDNEAPTVVEALKRGALPPGLEAAPAGVSRQLIDGWGAQLRELDVDQVLQRQRSLGIEILSPFDPRWPFGEDPDPPVLLFHTGDLDLLERPQAVAIVGTRRCTTVGRTAAYEIGCGVAAAGLAVVSGLALGVDGAAHRGALDAGGAAIGVVGSGLDVVYPGGNRSLWTEVSTHGLLLSEAPAGAGPERWRFPARNRLIAALSQGVVIVESHRRGGALLTVDEAIDRGRPVFVVPGSVVSSASDGTNDLLVDGAIPVRSSTDVLAQFGILTTSSPPGPVPRADAQAADLQPVVGDSGPPGPAIGVLSPLALVILAEVATGPVHLDRLLLIADSEPTELLAEVQALADLGRVVLDGSTVSRP